MISRRVRKAVIPVAGLGTRFFPVTKVVPKELLPIVDTPVIQYAVDEAIQAGIEQVILVTAKHKELIENYFDYFPELEKNFEMKQQEQHANYSRKLAESCEIVSVRQKKTLGLGHAIACAAGVIGQEPFAVLLPDDLVDAATPCIGQLIELFHERQSSVLGVMKVSEAHLSRYGIVGVDAIQERLWNVQSLVEKPLPKEAPSRLAIIGRYVLTPHIFDCLARVKPGRGGEIQLTDGLSQMIQQEKLLAYEFDGMRYDVGEPLGWMQANCAYALKKSQFADPLKQYLRQTFFS